MVDISNETLMALADDELNPIERARVEALVAKRPDLQVRLAAFTTTGKVLAPQFRKPFDEPLPRHLVELVMSGGDKGIAASKSSSTAAAKSAGMLTNLVHRLQNQLPRWPSALAYSVVLLVGTAGGWYLSRASTGKAPSTLDDGRLMASGGLERLLEQTPSGARLSMGGAESTRPSTILSIRLTFKNSDGYCRHYELTRPGGGSSEGIACRGSNGSWELKTHTSTDRGPVSEHKTKPAAGNGSSLPAAAVDRMIEGDALTVEEEAALIARRWGR